MPRVPRAAVQRIYRRHTHRKFGRVGAPYDDRASASQVAYERRVIWGDEIGESRKPVRRGLPLLVDIHLDRHRYAKQRTRLDSGCELPVGSGGLSQGLIGEIDHDRVQFGVDLTDAVVQTTSPRNTKTASPQCLRQPRQHSPAIAAHSYETPNSTAVSQHAHIEQLFVHDLRLVDQLFCRVTLTQRQAPSGLPSN